MSVSKDFQVNESIIIFTEFVPYVMQVLSLMLEHHPDISPAYIALYPCLLAPGLWERHSNVRALAQLLRAYVRNADATQFQTTVKVVSYLLLLINELRFFFWILQLKN